MDFGFFRRAQTEPDSEDELDDLDSSRPEHGYETGYETGYDTESESTVPAADTEPIIEGAAEVPFELRKEDLVEENKIKDFREKGCNCKR